MGMLQRWHRRSIDREVRAEILAKVSEQVGREREEIKKERSEYINWRAEIGKKHEALRQDLMTTAQKVREHSEADSVLAAVKILFAAAGGAKDSDLAGLVASQSLAQLQQQQMAAMITKHEFGGLPGLLGMSLGASGARLLG